MSRIDSAGVVEYVGAIHKITLQNLFLNFLLVMEAKRQGKEVKEISIADLHLTSEEQRKLLAQTFREMRGDGYVVVIKGDMVLLGDRDSTVPIREQAHPTDLVLTQAEVLQ